ncbi:MAG: HAD family hydrolase [Chloroflexi bacterium]|nr:HAD family hydrolase [Chloroflexota bacterium]
MSGLPIPVSHILLDVDGTLVDFAASLRAGTEAAAASLSERAGSPITARALNEARQRLAPNGRAGYSEIRLRAFRQVLRERGVDDERAVHEALGRDMAARHEALRSYDDVVDTLATLRAQGFVLIAATNGSGALGGTSLPDLLHGAWTAQQAGVSKPHPDFFRGALAHANATPQTTLMVGDRLDNDIEPAHSIGMPTVFLDRYGDHEETPPPARALIHTLADLPALVTPVAG